MTDIEADLLIANARIKILEKELEERTVVVRCKDCKFYGIDEDGFCFCECFGGLNEPDARDFCSYGERGE